MAHRLEQELTERMLASDAAKVKENDNKSNTRSFGKRNKGFIAFAIMGFLVVVNLAQNSSNLQRLLSINLGGGRCKWTAPEILDGDHPLNTTTALVSYPGSGKRLAWRVLEALTGKMSGDDWDLSENGFENVLTLKSSFPHPEGIWNWGANMDQVVLLVRNPRWAIPSYHTLRYEIEFSKGWDESYKRRNFTYKERAPVDSWIQWRDARFDREMDRWGWFIDFWMQDGLKRAKNDGDVEEQHWRCFKGQMDCTPKAVVKYESLVSSNRNTGRQEMEKLGSVLDSSPNVNAIEPEARNCVFGKVLDRKEFYNAARDGFGPATSEKVFTYQQLNAMRAQIETIRDKYAAEPWNQDPTAVDLVAALNSYIEEVQAEYELAVQEAYNEGTD